ncbi:MAG: ABC-2 transporter permease, partial [Slackia sp.]|nr:ABC-2 transporter permease [Slackia sp.]
MKAAFLSEFITSRNVLMQSLAIYAAASLVIGISMQSPTAMVACIGAMTPLMMVFTFCALDAANGWERFRATLPVSRAAIVASRYANVLAASVSMLLNVFIAALVLSAT